MQFNLGLYVLKYIVDLFFDTEIISYEYIGLLVFTLAQKTIGTIAYKRRMATWVVFMFILFVGNTLYPTVHSTFLIIDVATANLTAPILVYIAIILVSALFTVAWWKLSKTFRGNINYFSQHLNTIMISIGDRYSDDKEDSSGTGNRSWNITKKEKIKRRWKSEISPKKWYLSYSIIKTYLLSNAKLHSLLFWVWATIYCLSIDQCRLVVARNFFDIIFDSISLHLK